MPTLPAWCGRIIATAPDPAAARLQVEATVEHLLKGLASSDVSA